MMEDKLNSEALFATACGMDMEEAGGLSGKRNLPGMFSSNEMKKITKSPCMPGQKLCPVGRTYQAGEGTYQMGNSIYASVLGFMHVEEFAEQKITVVSVKRGDGKPRFIAPCVGSVVTCMVTSRNEYVCKCVITHVDETRLDSTFSGIIRRRFVYDKFRDLSKIETSFGVGDIVLARIVGINENYFILSTAEEDLGVANAVGEKGYCMVPVDWTRMECPKSGECIERKVARICLSETGSVDESEQVLLQ